MTKSSSDNRQNIIVLQTDFSNTWSAVSSMKGIIRKVDREVEIQDGTHEIEPFNIWMGAQELQTVELCWPDGTIFVSVVDPGVGSSRRACVCLLDNGNKIVTPDNGSLTLLKKAGRITAVREIDETKNRYLVSDASAVFDGRDLFAYTAAKLSAGLIDFEGVGPAYSVSDIVECPEGNTSPVVKDGYAKGFISHALSWYGGIRANITNEAFEKICGFRLGEEIKVTISQGEDILFQENVPFVSNFSEVPIGKPLVYRGSSLLISMDYNQGNFMRQNNLHAGLSWEITFERII